jgi:hypothetical protein
VEAILPPEGPLSVSRLSIVNGESRLNLSGSADVFQPKSFSRRARPVFTCAMD